MKEKLMKMTRENLVLFAYFLLRKIEKRCPKLFKESMEELDQLTED